MYSRFVLPIAAILTALLVAGCESRPPQGVAVTRPQSAGEGQPAGSAPTGPPGIQQPEPSESAQASSKPSAESGVSAAGDVAGETAPETPTREPEPRLPSYLRVLERFDNTVRANVRARLEPPTKLEIQTDNVKRLRLTRIGLPLMRGRSTVLRIDEQVFEWPQRSDVVELERSPNGVWMSVKLRRPRP
jgi:hypothetical protein